MTQIKLSPLDYIFIGPGSYPIEFVFFYPSGLPRKRLETRISQASHRVTDLCPVLSSQLTATDKGYVFETSSQLQSVPISWVKTDRPIHPATISNPYQLIDPVTTKPGEVLAKLKITEGSDGAALGFSLSHAVADGFTYFMMLSALAKATRDVSAPLKTIDHRRSLVSDLGALGLVGPLIGFSESSKRIDIRRSDITYSSRHFSEANLKDLYGTYATSTKRLSTNDMLCSELWREFATHYDKTQPQDLSLVMPTDFRRIVSGFPQNYAGNAIVLARVDRSRIQLLSESPEETAQAIRVAVQGVDESYVAKTIGSLAAKVNGDEYGGLGALHIVDPVGGLLITNLSRLSFSGLDFGTGVPTYCRPLTPCKRTIVLLSDGQSGVVAHIHS